MKKWYKEAYFNRKIWLLENYEKLNITNEELVLLLLVDLCKESKKAITYDYLTKKMSLEIKEIDNLMASLVNKHYLTLGSNAKGLVFDFDNVFEFDPNEFEISENKDFFETVAQVFGKPLSPLELQKLSDLLNEYSSNDILEALRIAEANGKLKLSYLEGILRNGK